MLPRIPEPEVMDSAAEAEDYDAMDHTQVNRLFVADFLQHWDGFGAILDVGAGTAQIPIELCRRHPTATVLAIDLAQPMLAVGERNVAASRYAAMGRRAWRAEYRPNIRDATAEGQATRESLARVAKSDS